MCKDARGLLYSMFILYLSYIYPILILYLWYVVVRERVGFFVILVENTILTSYFNPLRLRLVPLRQGDNIGVASVFCAFFGV